MPRDERTEEVIRTIEQAHLHSIQQGAERAIDAAIYAFAVTITNRTERQVFLQDFAAALDRRHLLKFYTQGKESEWWLTKEAQMEQIKETKP
jgi:hypothetical protein